MPPPAAQNAALVAEVKAVRARAADEALAAAAAAAALRSQIAAEEEEVRRCLQPLQPELGAFCPHLRRDSAHFCHICAGTGLTPAHI